MPALGSSTPAAIRSNVVLPEPLWPMSTTDWCSGMVRSRGANAGRSPYSFDRPAAHSAAPAGRFGTGAAFFAAVSVDVDFVVFLVGAFTGLAGWVGRAALDPVGFGWVRLITWFLAWRPAGRARPAVLLPCTASTTPWPGRGSGATPP